MTPKTCTQCAYAYIHHIGAKLLQCRRYAPAPSSPSVAYWPVVGATQWCGEWKARITAQPQHTRVQQLKELVPNLNVLFGDKPEAVTDEQVVGVVGTPRKGMYTDPRLNIPIGEMNLTPRAYNGLINYGWGEDGKDFLIKVVGDLVQCLEARLLKEPNLGRKTLNEYKTYLWGLGEPRLHLGMNPGKVP